MNNTYLYRDFNKYLLDKRVSKPHKNSRYATQGVAQVDNSIFITYYDTDKLKNSIVDIINNDGHITLELDNRSHVGGVSYNKEFNKVFISNNHFVNCYDLNEIKKLNHGDTLVVGNKLKVHEEVEIASYLTVFNNNLYIGRFNKDEATKLALYNINEEGITFNKLFNVPFKKVQGMCIYCFNGTLYYLFSRSYGRRNSSSLTVAKLVNDKFIKVKEFLIPCMAEQISVSDKNLMIVFESDCNKFNSSFLNNSKTKINNIIYLDIEKLLTDC